MRILIAIFLAVVLFMPTPVFPEKITASSEKKRLPEASAARTDEPKNFKISFRMKADELDAAGSFVVADGSQSNYVVKTTRDLEVKNIKLQFQYGAIVNCIAAARSDHPSARLECQFELSGPLQGASVVLLQLQTTFDAVLGETLVLVDEPTRHVEIKIEALAP